MESYWGKVSATLIGTVAGFIFSIFLFYLTESVKKKRAKEATLKSLQREFEYNIALIDSWKPSMDKAITQIAAGDQQVFEWFPFSRFSRIFTQQAFAAGLIFEVLNNEQAIALEDVLRFFSYDNETYVNNQIRDWKSGTLDQKEALRSMHYNQEMLVKYRKELASLKVTPVA
jgi:hypothetical protein